MNDESLSLDFKSVVFPTHLPPVAFGIEAGVKKLPL